MKLCCTLWVGWVVWAVDLAKRDVKATRQVVADQRIVGGVEVPPGDAPFQVSFQTQGKKHFPHFCGGSIVDPNFIVTAAHCCVFAKQVNSLNILAGLNSLRTPEDGFQNISVSGIIIHPDYDRHTQLADICILQLKDSLILSGERRTAMVELPPPDYTASGIAYVTGWGLTDDDGTRPDKLLRVAVPIVPDNVCRQKYPEGAVLSGMICAGGKEGKGSCQGDSGGPLVNSRGLLVGVVSWGTHRCGTAEKPGVYTEVSYFSQWIKNVVNSTPVKVQI